MVLENHTFDLEAQDTEFMDVTVHPSEREMVWWTLNAPNVGNPVATVDAGDGYLVRTDQDEWIENNVAHCGLTIVR